MTLWGLPPSDSNVTHSVTVWSLLLMFLSHLSPFLPNSFAGLLLRQGESSLFNLDEARRAQKEFGETVCATCFKLVFFLQTKFYPV